MRNILISSLLLASASAPVVAEEAPTETPSGVPTDTLRTVQLLGVEVVSSPKESGMLRQQPIAVSTIGSDQLAHRQMTSLKHISTMVPNLYIPHYGSRLTSAMYIRGIGSRINTPAVALYVDNVPYVDKSAFDFNFYDIERVDVLRGPQATLYGRNAMGGIVKVHTKNPFRYQGTDVRLGWASGNNRRTASLSHYHLVSDQLAFSSAGYYEATTGFFKNTTTGKHVDALQSGGGRMRAIYAPQSTLKLDLSASIDYSDEGAYPYYYTGTTTGNEQYADLIGSISNNRENRYRRLMANASLGIEWQAKRFTLNAVTGYQHLSDRMFLDQDFLSADIYSLLQKQNVNTLSEEITLRSKGTGRWQWITGANFMYQGLRTNGPVTFYSDGLRWLESNINSVMPSMDRIPTLQMMGFSGMAVNFRGDELVMAGTYRTPTLGLAAYHQSTYHFSPRFSASLGLRIDYEHRSMTYDSPASYAYGFTMPNVNNQRMAVDLQNLTGSIGYTGRLKTNQTRLLPKVALKYDIDDTQNVYASMAMGQRSGGYNLQMFSDLLQGSMRVDMIDGIRQGVGAYLDELATQVPTMPKQMPHPDDATKMIPMSEFVMLMMSRGMPEFQIPSTSQVVYKPECSWNYEVGTHLQPTSRLNLDAALYYSSIHDQQIARFASSGLGRMMVNAGRSRSFGAELTVGYKPTDALLLTANYGYTNSKFTRYDDGSGNDYSDHYVPFVPQHTVNADAAYTFQLKNATAPSLTLGVGYSGAGRIYWTEANDARQNYYSLLSARATLGLSFGELTVWGRNLTDTDYNTFYFVSASRGYEQHGTPAQMGVDLKITF